MSYVQTIGDAVMTIIRLAQQKDLDSIVTLLADDPLGSKREDPILPAAAEYKEAFRAITQDKNQFLAVAEIEGRVIGCLQLTFVPGLSHKGMWRGQIEGVRTAKSMRGQGICLLYTSPSPRDRTRSRMPSSA